MRKKLIIFGTSKISDTVYSTICEKLESVYEVVAFCVDRDYLTDNTRFDIPVVPFESIENFYLPSEHSFFVAIGYHEMNSVRAEKCKQVRQKGYKIANCIHPDASVPSNVKLGENILIMDKASIGAFSQIGNNTFIYSGAVIAHHSKIGNNNWITSGTVIGGNSEVGDNNFFGIHCTIGHNIRIGNRNFIGAGTLVSKNTEDNSVYIMPDTPKYRLDTDRFIKLFKFD